MNIKVEVAYATKSYQILLELMVPANSSIKDIIIESQILEKINSYPKADASNHLDITLDNIKVGIFGKIKELSDTAVENDRVEIYRELVQDPKELRRKREKKNPINKRKK